MLKYGDLLETLRTDEKADHLARNLLREEGGGGKYEPRQKSNPASFSWNIVAYACILRHTSDQG